MSDKQNNKDTFKEILGKEYRITYSREVFYYGTHGIEPKYTKTIIATVENFTTIGGCAFYNEDGLHIIPYKSILFLEPIKK